MNETPGFFAALPVLATPRDTFDPARHGRAPDDWCLVVTDIVDSTGAIAAGRHKTVNFVAAMAIGALRNLCAPEPIPFLFGGDGAVVMVPPRVAAQARAVLARVRGLAAREYGLALRIGLAPVGEIRRCGAEVLVGRFEPSPGNSFGVFLGGGVGLLEDAIRGRGHAELAALAAVPEALDDGQAPDLSGLSCRWDALRSQRGCMLTVIVQGAADPGAVYDALMRLAGPEPETRPVSVAALLARWPPTGFMNEVRARRRGGWLPLWVAWVLLETLLAWAVIRIGRPVGGFDPARYRAEIAANTDFCKHDQTLCCVIDCPLEAVASIRAWLDAGAAAGAWRHGLHVSETALMTCLVVNTPDGLHVHFVDGGGGGYTQAAKALKLSRPSG